jgi:hypothetical protein
MIRQPSEEEVRRYRQLNDIGLMEARRALERIHAICAVDEIKVLDNNESNIKDILRYLVGRS